LRTRSNQRAGDNATQTVIHVDGSGITPEQAKSISNETFMNNFPTFMKVAEATAANRVAELTEKIVDRMSILEGALESFSDPDFLCALNAAQTNFARVGGDELGDFLTEVISDRSDPKNHSMLDFVLSEAVEVAPRLSVEQIDAVAMLHILNETKLGNINSIQDLEKQFCEGSKKITQAYNCSSFSFSHLEYFGVVSINKLYKKDIFRKFHRIYFGNFDNYNIDEFREDVKNTTILSETLKWYDKNELSGVNLTSVGKAIGIARIRQHFTGYEYSTWIK